jgi:hypothetical protein
MHFYTDSVWKCKIYFLILGMVSGDPRTLQMYYNVSDNLEITSQVKFLIV